MGKGCIGGLQDRRENWQHEDATMMMFTDECAVLEHTVPVISASLACSRSHFGASVRHASTIPGKLQVTE